MGLHSSDPATVSAEAGALTDWLAGVVVTPRFPTPIDKELRPGASPSAAPGV